ncbi:histidine kinase [Nonomuraea sp. 3N208]|uniref:histidine kinase n=1 Tax=Nonomuraea sp. 3N208 TaxID=3457421 RepID=UPI003FD4A7F9
MRKTLFLRWACLILGGALLMPYMMAGVLVAAAWQGEQANLLLPAQVGVFAAVLPVVAVTGLFLPVRGLEVNAAQGLLGAHVETPPRQQRRSWQERRRTSAWFTSHLAVGGVVSGFTLAIVPFTLYTLVLPFTGRPAVVLGFTIAPGWAAALWALGGLVLLAALVAMAAGAGALLARLAPVLLGPTPSERLAAAEEHARTLAERNRLARELHDSVGHALSVVTLQAAAAGRVLDRDPATARTALAAIEQSARAALDDLDHVLGLLRHDAEEGTTGQRTTEEARHLPDRTPRNHAEDERQTARVASADDRALAGASRAGDRADGGSRPADRTGGGQGLDDPASGGQGLDDPASGGWRFSGPASGDGVDGRSRRRPQGTLADLGELVAASGVQVRQEVGDLSGVPAVVSREAYRILQEALTNAIKHGRGPVRLSAAVHGDDLCLEVANPGGGNGARSGGRGVAGMRERVRLLRGDLEAGPAEAEWKVTVRLPLRSSP